MYVMCSYGVGDYTDKHTHSMIQALLLLQLATGSYGYRLIHNIFYKVNNCTRALLTRPIHVDYLA